MTFRLIAFLLIIAHFCGCASIPKTKTGVTLISINGVSYCSLPSLCQAKSLDCEYDILSRTIIIRKPQHQVNMMVGDKLILVDGKPTYLKQPVDIYRGTIVVPYKFQEQILDVMLREKSIDIKKAISFNNIKKVVIDAGHGGNDPGAIGKSGVREKDIVLDIAKRLKKMLNDSGVSAVMTREYDKFVPLAERVNIANKSNADLFISVHANANPSRSLTGFEVYYISAGVSDVQRALASAKQVRLNLDNSSFAQASPNLKAILWDMIHSYNRAQAIELSRSICQQIDHNTNARILGVKSANFCVLRGTCMPAVLVEVGFVSNKVEEQLLKDNLYRQKLAESIKDGIQDYAQKIDLSCVLEKKENTQLKN